MRVDHVINQFPQCGVGNKLLHYWNLRQISNETGHGWNMIKDKDIDSLINVPYPHKSFMLREMRKQMVLPFSLGENFFKYVENRVPIEEIFTPVVPKVVNLHSLRECSIHLRGGDFRVWKNGEGMLTTRYYLDAIDHIIGKARKEHHLGVHFSIITDDATHPTIDRISEHMRYRRVMYNYDDESLGKSISNDWNKMVSSDYIISSPSTFAITAGMISDAYITHSKVWVDARVAENDPFWVGLNNDGNSEYKATLI